ncbi:MAG: amino acid ABC transporter substrate-binding protein [Deltaproteobacteria bacterium]|nr:amino acid ABC transporter substrate-binding protein [Deltaproteobacteria bacterium]
MGKSKWMGILIITLMVFGLAVTAGAVTLEEIIQRGELVVACQTQGPPFSFVDKKGERTGSSIELCKVLAQEMGVKIKFLDYDWDGLIPALLSKKADMLAADMTATPKRALKINFTNPFVVTKMCAFTKQDSAIKALADGKKEGLKIAVLLGSTGESTAKKLFPKAEIKPYKGGGPLLLDAVLQGHADFGVNDESAVTGQLASFPPNSIRILKEKLSQEPLAFAVRYDSPELREWINLFFETARMDGRMDQNLNYWVNSNEWEKEHK